MNRNHEYVTAFSSRDEDRYDHRNGYLGDLKTTVARVRDDVVIAEGSHSIWIPDYQNM
jgi:hypothetical protein